MPIKPFLCALVFGVLTLPLPASAQEAPFVRGDSNGSGSVDISDAVHILNFLFLGGSSPRCRAEADVNASGTVEITDAIVLLNALFLDPTELSALSEDEILSCSEPVVMRSGTLMGRLPQATEERGVDGIVEEMSNRTIRLRHFYYDGQGAGRVYVWLHHGGDMSTGHAITADFRRPFPGYVDETLEFPIPAEMTDDTFHSVAIWCYDFDQNFGSARLEEP